MARSPAIKSWAKRVTLANSAAPSAPTCWRFAGDPDRCTIRINNSILYANSAQYGTEIYNGSKNFYVQNSLVEGSGGSSGWKAQAVDKGGNIDADPQFFVPVDPASAPTIAGDFRQRLASPVVNTGNNALILRQPISGTTDFAGNPRVFDTTVDMGPYEVSIKCPAAGTTRLYVNALANGGNLGTSWADALAKVQDALALVDNCPGNTISRDLGRARHLLSRRGLLPDQAATVRLPLRLNPGWRSTAVSWAPRRRSTSAIHGPSSRR